MQVPADNSMDHSSQNSFYSQWNSVHQILCMQSFSLQSFSVIAQIAEN